MWVRFDDGTPDHPKFSELGDYAPLCGWLWFSAICYSGRYLTDGRVDLVTLRRLWPYRHIGVAESAVLGSNGEPLAEFGEDPTADDLVKLLVAARLLEEIEPGLYRVHDYLEYNWSRHQVLQMRKKKVKAGQAGGQASAQARALASGRRVLGEGMNTDTHTETNTKATSSEIVRSESGGAVEKRAVPKLVEDVLQKRKQELLSQVPEAERIHRAKQGEEPSPF